MGWREGVFTNLLYGDRDDEEAVLFLLKENLLNRCGWVGLAFLGGLILLSFCEMEYHDGYARICKFAFALSLPNSCK